MRIFLTLGFSIIIGKCAQLGYFSFLNPVWDFLLGWTLSLPPLAAILLVSFILSVIVMLAYKYTTDQNVMKQLKDELNAFQKEMKDLKAHPEKAMEVQGKAMETNMKYMMHSLNATIYTILPIVLIFGWLSAHYAFMPIAPAQEFSVEIVLNQGINGTVTADVPDGIAITGDEIKDVSKGPAVFTYKSGQEGTYPLSWTVDGRDYTKDVLVTKGKDYLPNQELPATGPVKSITVGLEKVIVMDLFGWKLGWFGSYIIFSIVFSMALRKVFNVY
jgi:uncharacterized membrane protein (DUF106 family)